MTEDERAAVVAPTSLLEAQRRRKGVQAALDRLERAVAAPSTDREGQWASRVAEEIRALAAAFENHIVATEQPGGLFDDILAEAPRLSHQIQVLRLDHSRIADAILATLALAERPDAAGLADEISERVLDLLTRVTRHRHVGSSLVYEAYTVDIDAAD